MWLEVTLSKCLCKDRECNTNCCFSVLTELSTIVAVRCAASIFIIHTGSLKELQNYVLVKPSPFYQ